MIFHKHKVIYYHIPRTGGTSIINKFIMLGEITRLEHSHKIWKYYRDQYGMEIFDKYFKFAVIRNPYDKVFSSYCHNSKEYKDFNKWLLWVDQIIDKRKAHVLGSYFHWFGRQSLYDDLIRFEKFKKGWNRICKKIGINNSLKHLNVSKANKLNYRNYYNQESKNIVKQHYERDLDIFKYVF